MTRYWVQPRVQPGFLSFAKNISRNIGKNISTKLSNKWQSENSWLC